VPVTRWPDVAIKKRLGALPPRRSLRFVRFGGACSIHDEAFDVQWASGLYFGLVRAFRRLSFLTLAWEGEAAKKCGRSRQ
jgi:hypothetical protein